MPKTIQEYAANLIAISIFLAPLQIRVNKSYQIPLQTFALSLTNRVDNALIEINKLDKNK